MFLLRRPSNDDVRRFLDDSRGAALSYRPVGITMSGPPRGFVLDEKVTIVGSGEPAFARAKAAVAGWKQFDLGWLQLHPAGASTEPGTVVILVIQHAGFWSMNAARVLPALRPPPAHTFEVLYGALVNHAQAGEEVFRVTFDPVSGEVRYTIRAVSRPRTLLA